jgi:hypothetical protein
MRAHLTWLLALALLATPALGHAQTRPKPAHPAARPAPSAAAAPAPKLVGRYEDWTAATHTEAGQTVCYAFTRANGSSPVVSGRGDVVLTVTERPALRDAVAISAGFVYPAKAEVSVKVDQASFDFYTSRTSAFARDGHAVVLALQKGKLVTARSPGPKSGEVTDTFSLRGFSAAYAAIVKACPAK